LNCEVKSRRLHVVSEYYHQINKITAQLTKPILSVCMVYCQTPLMPRKLKSKKKNIYVRKKLAGDQLNLPHVEKTEKYNERD